MDLLRWRDEPVSVSGMMCRFLQCVRRSRIAILKFVDGRNVYCKHISQAQSF